jgi:tetratricopeptide (TPR) repeat protein
VGADDPSRDTLERALANTNDGKARAASAGESAPNGFAPTIVDGAERAPDESGDMPTMVDRFLIEDELGAGGMGRVYVAYDPSLDRKVAVKLLLKSLGLDRAKAKERMAREARAMAKLRHPNVVAVHEVGTPKEGGVYIVMEYVAGGTLREWLQREPAPDWKQIVQMYTYAGRGLAAAHEAGLVHRDFKPDNVLVGEDGRVQVTDFGIANIGNDVTTEPPREREQQPGLTRAGSVVGTPPYMAPEQHEGKLVDTRTDQFAFCAALYEALYGVRPFAGTTHTEIAERAIRGQITPPVKSKGAPARIENAIRRGLRPDPADRFPSMAALLAALAVKPKRSPLRWIAAGLLAIAAVVAIVLATRGSSTETATAKPVGLVAVESFDVALTSYLGRWEWREGIGDVIAILVGDIDGFRSTGPSTMLGREGIREARDKPTRPDFRAAELQAGASFVVHGALEERDGTITAQVRVMRADGSELAALERKRPAAELFMLLDDIAAAIATTLAPGAKLPDNGANRARALHAIGEDYLRNNDFQMARPFLEQAVLADRKFYDGWYSLMLARSWVLAPESTVTEALEAASATAPTPTKKKLVEGIRHYLRHEHPKARAVLEKLVDDRSLTRAELRDALYFLGEAHWHDGHHRAGTTYFKKTLDVDTKFKLPLSHLGEYASANRDIAMMNQYSMMVATSARELRDRVAFVEGRYHELVGPESSLRLHAVLLLGRTPTPEDEGEIRSHPSLDTSIYRAAFAIQIGDLAAARKHCDDVWKAVEERKRVGELADNFYYVLRQLGDVVIAGGLADESKRIVTFLAEQSKVKPVRSYQRLSILTAPLVGDRSLIVRRDLTERDVTLADAIEAEMAGDHAKAATLLDQLVKDPSPYWDYPERVALLRNLRKLGRTKEAKALCDDTLKPALFQWSFLPARRACKQP